MTKLPLLAIHGVLQNSTKLHYNDVIMGAIASQITSLTIVYSTVYSDADQRKHQSSASLAFVRGNSRGTGDFPAQMASNAENVSIWWRHNVRNVNALPLYAHVAEVIMHGRPEVTLVDGAAYNMFRSVISLLLANVCGIHTCTTIQLVFINHVAHGSS